MFNRNKHHSNELRLRSSALLTIKDRITLKALGRDCRVSAPVKAQALAALSSMDQDYVTSPVRFVNRCRDSGKSTAVQTRYHRGRFSLLNLARASWLPGTRKKY